MKLVTTTLHPATTVTAGILETLLVENPHIRDIFTQLLAIQAAASFLDNMSLGEIATTIHDGVVTTPQQLVQYKYEVDTVVYLLNTAIDLVNGGKCTLPLPSTT